MTDLRSKAFVIIGGTSGIGLEASKAMAAHGAKLIITGIDQDICAQAEKELGLNGIAICADARISGTTKDAIDLCIQEYGDFHGLYHVAGGSGRRAGDGPLHELSLEGWNYTLDLNLTSVMLSNQAAVRAFLALGHGGTILNMASVLGFAPSPHHFATHAYAAAKSAIIGFTKSIAAYYASHNIRVNAIAPGLVHTPMAKRAATNESIMKFIKTKQALDGGRIGKADDLNGIALYCMSDQSCFTTGQLFTVDGGWSVSEGQY